jgi:hypothetical protein
MKRIPPSAWGQPEIMAFQSVQMRVEVGTTLMTFSFPICFLYKKIKMISFKINPLSAKAGKPVPPDSLE